MNEQILEIPSADWQFDTPVDQWIAALEAGKVLHFSKLPFVMQSQEAALLDPAVLAPQSRNISLDQQGLLRGAAGDVAQQAALSGMLARFSHQARQLIDSLVPAYRDVLRIAPASYRPMQVETRAQSWRADDRRLHIDAFPSRPNRGERILRIFTNIHPSGIPRVWRVGEPFEDVARRYLPKLAPYSRWRAGLLRALRVTKSLRSEYDHLMLQLHDAMKSDLDYQQSARQVTMPFAAGSTWVCFSDQASHAVMSGQFMLEQTLHLPAAKQVDPAVSPLATLTRLVGHTLI